MSQYGEVTLDTLTFTGSSETTGYANETMSLEVELKDTDTNPVENAPIYFHWLSGDFHGLDHEAFVYDNGSYAVTDSNGKATALLKVVNIGETIINASVNDPSELNSANETLTLIDNETEIYITNFKYQGSSWFTNINAVFDYVDAVFRDISNFDFFDLAISHIEIIDANQNTSNEAILFVKRGKYNDNSYLSDSDSSTLRTAIINKLNSESDITFNDVEVRSQRKEKI